MFEPDSIEQAYFDAESAGAGEWERKQLEHLPEKLTQESWTLADVVSIYLWKRNERSRAKTLVFSLNVDDEIIEIIKDAAVNRTSIEKFVEQVDQYKELGPATASAFMTFADPDYYTPTDRNVRAALRDIGKADSSDLSVGEVNQHVRDLAETYNCSLRTVDRGLYLHKTDNSNFSLNAE